jgi:uncharacterized protein (DUF427 family)
MTHGKAIATVSGRTIAETDEYEVVEGNIYVRCPLAFFRSVKMEMMTKTDHITHCPWKGAASYYTINLDSKCSLEELKVMELMRL